MAIIPSKFNPFLALKKLVRNTRSHPEENCVQSFDKRQETEEAYTSIKRGTSQVPLDRIVGSVGRYHDFDSQFKPRAPENDERQEAIVNLMQAGKTLPPISLYQIKDDYFILDGHHRFTAARSLGQTHINACILELYPQRIPWRTGCILKKRNSGTRPG